MQHAGGRVRRVRFEVARQSTELAGVALNLGERRRPIGSDSAVLAAFMAARAAVTTSAFLDLVSAEWIERLVTEIAVRKLRSTPR